MRSMLCQLYLSERRRITHLQLVLRHPLLLPDPGSVSRFSDNQRHTRRVYEPDSIRLQHKYYNRIMFDVWESMDSCLPGN